MSRKSLLLLSTALIVMPITTPASFADERYASPPAVVLSPDLTSVWTLQLKRQPVKTRNTKQVRSGKKTVRNLFKRKKPVQTAYQRNRNTQRTGIFALWNMGPEPTVNQRAKKRQQAHQQNVPQATASQSAAYIQQQAAQRPIDPRYLPRTVRYETNQKPGSIIIDTNTRYLYLVQENGKARRYGVGVGKQGFEWRGTEKITRKAEWPSWRPPAEMIARERKKGRELPTFMEGGPANPLGARALYLGSTLYRIHGTNQPWTIGQAVSSGCIRMRNEDVMDLYERIRVGAKVTVT